MNKTYDSLKWHHLYYLLGTIDIIALCFSLFLNHTITKKYEQAVFSNEFWSKMRQELRSLENTASSLNAPGNDVFESRDIAKERRRLNEASAIFSARVELFRKLIIDEKLLDPPSMTNDLGNIDFKAQEMKNQTEQVFTEVSFGNIASASRSMALLDRQFSDLRNLTEKLALNFAKAHDKSLRIEEQRVIKLRTLGISVVIFVLIMIAGIILYGLRINHFIGETNAVVKDTHDALNASAIVAVTDARGIIRFVNDKFCEISGYRRDELIGKDHRLINSRIHSKEFFQDLWKTIRRGNIWRGEVCNRRKDGSLYWVDSTVVPKMDQEGKITEYTAIRYDITDRKKSEDLLHQQRLELDQFFNLSSDLLCIAHIDGRFKKVSSSFKKALGFSEEELLTKPFTDFIVNDDLYAVTREMKNLASGIPITSFKCRFHKKDGSHVHLSWTCTPADDGTIYAVGRDVTEQLTIEEHLRSAKERAEVAVRTKANFLATMSHEIRTPMNGIIGNTSLLIDTNLTEEQRDMLWTIKSSGDALLTLLDDILDFSKIEAGKLEIEEKAFDLNKAVTDAIKVILPRANEKAISLKVSIEENVPPIIVTDYVRFRQILLNLLSNAVKFTDKGTVSTSVKILSEQDGKLDLIVSVKDSGIGISPEQQEKLFLEFSQVDGSTTRKYGGTGLGLAICKHLCGLLGGSINVSSSLGHGSTFSFSASVRRGDGLTPVNVMQLAKKNQNALLGKLHPLRILVAEDNKTNQILTKKFLLKIGYEAHVVDNGTQAFAAAKSAKYDVILMDVHMPELDGYEATQRIRHEIPTMQQPYIIALTASVMAADRKLCIDAGMDDFLKKPMDIVELQDAIEIFIKTKDNAATKSKLKVIA